MQEATEQYYVDFDSKSNICGFYVNTIHGNNIPESAIPITTELWQTYSNNSNRYKRDGDDIREKTQEEIDAEVSAQPPIPLTPDQMKIEQMKIENEQLNMSIIEIWESIIPLLPA